MVCAACAAPWRGSSASQSSSSRTAAPSGSAEPGAGAPQRTRGGRHVASSVYLPSPLNSSTGRSRRAGQPQEAAPNHAELMAESADLHVAEPQGGEVATQWAVRPPARGEGRVGVRPQGAPSPTRTPPLRNRSAYKYKDKQDIFHNKASAYLHLHSRTGRSTDTRTTTTRCWGSSRTLTTSTSCGRARSSKQSSGASRVLKPPGEG